ncbi:hypothetical protein ACJX0J_020409, partial [Zea mays]
MAQTKCFNILFVFCLNYRNGGALLLLTFVIYSLSSFQENEHELQIRILILNLVLVWVLIKHVCLLRILGKIFNNCHISKPHISKIAYFDIQEKLIHHNILQQEYRQGFLGNTMVLEKTMAFIATSIFGVYITIHSCACTFTDSGLFLFCLVVHTFERWFTDILTEGIKSNYVVPSAEIQYLLNKIISNDGIELFHIHDEMITILMQLPEAYVATVITLQLNGSYKCELQDLELHPVAGQYMFYILCMYTELNFLLLKDYDILLVIY